MNLKCFFAIGLLLLGCTAFSQNLSGTITAQNNGKFESMPGVIVYWMGTNISTSTDANGKFKITKKEVTDFRLIINMMGFKIDTIQINPALTHLEHVLTQSNINLDAVEIKENQESSFISKVEARKVQVLTTGELYKAACCNLSESFETNASVDVTYSDAITGAKQIQLLGLSGNYCQIQTENIPLIRGMASTYGLNYIPGSWMQSIQISKGTSSVINGYESVTGQINIEYKKPSTSEKLFVNIYGNEKSRIEGNLNIAIPVTEKLSTMFMLHGDYFNKEINKINTYEFNGVNTDDMSLLLDGDGNQVKWTKPDKFLDIPKLYTINLFNRWDYIVPNKYVSRLGIKYMLEDRKGGTTDYDKKTFQLDTSRLADLPYGFELKTNRAEAFWKNGFMFKGKPYKSVGLILSGIYHDQNGFFGVNAYHGIEKSFYANLIYQSILGSMDHKFSTGASFLYDDYSERYAQIQFLYVYQTLPANSVISMHDIVTLSPLTNMTPVNYNSDRTEMVPGAFFEYTYTHKKDFTLILGVRGDYSSEAGFFFTPRMNVRWDMGKDWTLRASAGMGYRTPDVIAENLSLLASQRIIRINGKPKQEAAANYGLNLVKEFTLLKHKASVDIDVYRTDFLEQVIVDLDKDPAIADIYNMSDSSGTSYSNSYQIQFSFEPLDRFTILTAFRVNDAWQTTGGKHRERMLLSKYKGLITLSYATKFEKWKFDITGQFNGPARISDQSKMPGILRRDYNYSPFYPLFNAQISKKFRHEITVYLGCENILNFRQKDPITEPFLPYHTHFDTSMAWGPLAGRTIYGGLRFALK